MDFFYGIAIGIVVLNIFFSFSLIFIERKDPTTTWAWLLILLVLPGLGFIIYLLFGQNLSRQKIFKDKIISDEKKRMASNQDIMAFSKHNGGGKFADIQKMNFNNSGAKYTVNNSVDVYTNGEDKFKQLIEDIRNAKSYIHVEYYIFKKDILGKRVIEELSNTNYIIRKSGERIALNTGIQGTGADIIKKAMIEIDKEITKRNLNTKMLVQVHDELVFSVPFSELEEMKTLVKQIMENTYKILVPLKVEIEVGDNWYDAK